MSINAKTDSNTNPIGASPNVPLTISTVLLIVPGGSNHSVFLIGHYSADPAGAAGGSATASILVNGNVMLDTLVNNLQGSVGTLLSLSSVLTLPPGKYKFELQAYVTNMTSASIHHRSLTVMDLG